MSKLSHLFDKNRAWSEAMRQREPDFFPRLSRQQSPDYLWIGCSDSRVPANQVVGLLPGEIFVHRNIANVVVHTDLNALSVVQFAVDLLKVRHIIVCGHYGCAGVRAALRGDCHGLVDNWLRHVQDVRDKHRGLVRALDNDVERADRLCELNVIEQALHLCRTSIVREAWQRGQELTVHSWIYGLHDGLIRDLGMAVASWKEVEPAHRQAVASLGRPAGARPKRVTKNARPIFRAHRAKNN